jgi:DNA-binding NarL/FixJ family response regulator
VGDRPKRRGVLLVDDHPLFRKGMTQLLGQAADFEVRAEANNSLAALDAIRKEKFDLAIIDVGLGGKTNGIELIKMINAEQPELRMLIVSMHDEALYAERALRAGARGYVMKREAPDSILNAVRDVLSGGIYVSTSMSKQMLHYHIQGRGEACSPVEGLTDRELEIFQLIGEGNDMHEIARQLHLSKKTVEAHRANIKEKLSISSAREVVRHATQWVAAQG